MARRCRTEKIDCTKPEPADPPRGSNRESCKWCGRPCKWTYSGKFFHRKGYRRMHPDPRESPVPNEIPPEEGGPDRPPSDVVSIPPGYWPCACVRHKSMGKGKPKQLISIKLHAPEVSRCRVCGSEKPAEEIIRQVLGSPCADEGPPFELPAEPVKITPKPDGGLPAGWAFGTASARKACYFRAGSTSSICGKVAFFFSPERFDDNHGSADNCAKCKRMRGHVLQAMRAAEPKG